jgi:hypothetical protein
MKKAMKQSIDQPEENLIDDQLYVWEKLTGKYHFKTPDGRKIIKPGEIFLACKNRFADDNTWAYKGPAGVTASSMDNIKNSQFTKEYDEEAKGFFVLDRLGNRMNDLPLTAKEVDEFINAALGD